MGFRGTLAEGICRVQVYTHEHYELLAEIVCDGLSGMTNQFTDISLVLDNTFIIGSHIEGYFTVINLEENSLQEIVEQPFGQVQNIWGVEVFGTRPEGEPQIVFIPSTNGLYQCMVTPQG